MEAPENLVDAVSRLRPTAILLLDTNTIMDTPRLESYEIAAPGPFLVVVPIVVYHELMGKKLGHRDQHGRQKASQALKAIDDLYARGNAQQGIELSGDRRLISVQSPKEEESVEDGQARRNFGKVDAALLRLSIACAQDCPDTPTLLVTSDKNLARSARAHGLTVCRLHDLRSSEELGNKLRHAGLVAAPELDILSLLDLEEERTARVTMTLEEIRSEGDYLIARGAGLLRDEGRYQFRWTFPYKDYVSRHGELDYTVMPSENLDFMAADEQITEPVRNGICGLLEDSVAPPFPARSLLSPRNHMRVTLSFLLEMEWGYFGPINEMSRLRGINLDEEDAAKYDDLRQRHNQHEQSLLDGTASSFAEAYRSMFELRVELLDLLGAQEWSEETSVTADLETGLISFLDDVLDAWSVGETREEEFPFTPFAWPDYEQEAIADEEDADH